VFPYAVFMGNVLHMFLQVYMMNIILLHKFNPTLSVYADRCLSLSHHKRRVRLHDVTTVSVCPSI